MIFQNLRRAMPGVSLTTYSKILRWLWISAFFWLVLLAAVSARAQTSPTLVFTSSVSIANGKLDTTLTWSTVPVATSCTAGGTPTAWTGAKQPSGSFVLPTITHSGTYTPTLTCVWSAVSTLQLTWVPPTQNTDGTTLADLASYNVYYGQGTNPSLLTTKVSVAKTITTWTSSPLAPGVWSGYVTAMNASGAESANSNIASKTIAASTNDTESITLTVNPIPNAPSSVTAQ